MITISGYMHTHAFLTHTQVSSHTSHSHTHTQTHIHTQTTAVDKLLVIIGINHKVRYNEFLPLFGLLMYETEFRASRDGGSEVSSAVGECVCEGEREREREICVCEEGERERERE